MRELFHFYLHQKDKFTKTYRAQIKNCQFKLSQISQFDS